MALDHCAWLADDGSVWTSGNNNFGQLGLGDQTSRNRPSRLPNLPPISSVQSGSSSTLCLDSSGNLWSYGRNTWGQLGLGDTAHRFSPEMVPGIPPVLSFSFHYIHVLCLCENGSIWTFGDNTYGQLGLGHLHNQIAPVQLPSSLFPNALTSVECGSYHSLFLTSEGQVLACGYNAKGQLGQGDSTNRSTPNLILNMNDCVQIACGGSTSCVIDSSHRLWVCGSHSGIQTTPLCFPSVGLIQNISVGYQHILCINQSSELWEWGNPIFGILNGSRRPSENPMLIKNNIQHASALGHSSFIQEVNGATFCSGSNSKGQLGLGNTRNQLLFSKFRGRQEEGEEGEPFRMCFPVGIRKFSQKSARSALPLPV